MSSSRYPNRSIAVTLILITALSCVLVASGVGTAADGTDEFVVSDATETPVQTVNVEGNEYEITSILTIEPGQALTVDVSVGDDTRFDAYLYNTERQIEASEIGTGPQEIAFDTDSLSSGSYVLALYVDGNYVDVQPVIVEGYDVSATPPAEVEADADSIEIETTVTETELEEQPANVEVVVWNDDNAIREDASHVEDGTYQATISSADFEEGESYNVYAVAQGADEIEAEDEPELLGMSDGGTFDVISSEDDTDGTIGSPGGGSDTDDSDSPVDDPENGTDENGNNGGNVSDGGDPEGNSSDGESPNEDGNSSNESNNETNESPDDLIQPNSSDDTDNEPDDTDSTPSFAVPLLAIATLIITFTVRILNSRG